MAHRLKTVQHADQILFLEAGRIIDVYKRQGYAVKVAGYALATMLAHVSAYTILEGLRLQVADRLMGAPLGEVESRPIGSMKSTIVDRIEDVEPPLAHMIPELSSNLLLPLVVVIAMLAIDSMAAPCKPTKWIKTGSRIAFNTVDTYIAIA